MTPPNPQSDQQLRIAAAEALGWKGPDHPDTKAKCNDAMNAKGLWWLNPEGLLTAPKVYTNGKLVEGVAPIGMPDPLNSISDAFALVEQARKEGCGVSIYHDITEWSVEFWKPDRQMDRDKPIYATDPSLPRAITLAFLKLKGKL